MNEEILEGLKLAMFKGESLKLAMMSFYNAGYKKEEIEEAARNLQKENYKPQEPQQQKPEQIEKSPKQKPKKTTQKVSSYGTPMQTQMQNSPGIKQNIDAAIEQLKKINVPSKQKSPKETSPQNISNYEKEPGKPKGKIIVFILVFFLLFLLGALAAVFLFRQELINFFNNLS